MMRLPKWLRLDDTWSDSRHRRDSEDDPKPPPNPSGAPGPPQLPAPPQPPPPPPGKSPKPLKTVSVTLTTTMTMMSTISAPSSTSSTTTTTLTSVLSTSSSTSSTSEASTSSSTTSSSVSFATPTTTSQQSTRSATPAVETISLTSSAESTTTSATSLTAEAITSSSTTTSKTKSSSQTPSLTLSIPSTSASSTVTLSSATDIAQLKPTISTEENRSFPPATSSTSTITTASPVSSPELQPVSPVESPISNPSAEVVAGTQGTQAAHHAPGTFVLIGIAIGASTAIIISLILLFCRRRSIKKRRERSHSKNIPRPTNKRMSWNSQAGTDLKREYSHSSSATSVQSQYQNQNQNSSPILQNANAFSTPNLGRIGGNGSNVVGSIAQQFSTAGGTVRSFVPQQQVQGSIRQGAGLQRSTSSATTATQGTQFQEPMAVYEDQLPAFAARLKELGIVGAGAGNGSTTNSSRAPSDIGTTGYAPQLQLPPLDLSGGNGGNRKDSYGWFGSTMSASVFESQATSSHVADYTISPIEQRQMPVQTQTQQPPWQIQLPNIEEARRGSQTSSNIGEGAGNGQVYELSADTGRVGDGSGGQRYLDEKKAWNVSGSERVIESRPGGEAAPRWKDPLAWAREQRLRQFA